MCVDNKYKTELAALTSSTKGNFTWHNSIKHIAKPKLDFFKLSSLSTRLIQSSRKGRGTLAQSLPSVIIVIRTHVRLAFTALNNTCKEDSSAFAL